MNPSRKTVYDIFTRKNGTGKAFWTGNPKPEAVQNCAKAWGIEANNESVYTYLNDDVRWIPADMGYHHPEGLAAFNPSLGVKRETLSAPGCLADAETIADIDKYPWPDAKYCDFSDVYRLIEQHQDKMVLTGMWACFFHIVADFFGMENYFMKMYDNPMIVDAVTERVVDFFVEANDLFFEGLGDRADAVFFGNDFGTQLDLFLSPALFRRFVLPSLKRIIATGKKYGKIVVLHSCGSIYRVIPDLIDSGVDVLHPLQACAVGMSADDLKQYRNDLAFLGGIDAQGLMTNGTPEQIRREVFRVRETLGPNIVISPSHEAILGNVPPENVLALARAAKE